MASFTGGAKLQAKLAEIAKKAESTGTLRVGFLESATYPDGTPVAAVAAANEFGHVVHTNDGDYSQLPRPFFRQMIADGRDKWGPALGKIIKAVDYDADKALGQMGEGMKGQLQGSIQKLDSPPLADSTVKRKGFPKPLVDTGHMQNSVDYEVKK